jgi:uncharacterized membrane protein
MIITIIVTHLKKEQKRTTKNKRKVRKKKRFFIAIYSAILLGAVTFNVNQIKPFSITGKIIRPEFLKQINIIPLIYIICIFVLCFLICLFLQFFIL